MFTDQQIRDFIQAQGIGDNPYALYNYAKQYGVAPGRIDQVMGYAPGTSDRWIQQQGLQGLAGGTVGGAAPTTGTYTDDQVRAFIQQQGIADNPHAIYAFAGQYGVTPGQIDSAMGYSPGSATGWQQSAGLTGQVPAGVYSAPAPVAAPATTGAAGSPQMQPPAGNMQPPAGFPSMGTYAMPTTQATPPATPQAPTQNPYLPAMADDITRRASTQFMQQINPAINRAAVANGGYGGSRQGIAQGLAMSQGMDNIAGQLSGLYANQFNADRNYGLANDALDLNVYNANQNWMRQGQQDQLGLADRLLGWNQQYGVGNATQVQNTPLNYWQQFGNTASQFAGLGGQQSQQMQGNPYLGALGGAMTAGNLWKSWGS